MSTSHLLFMAVLLDSTNSSCFLSFFLWCCTFFALPWRNSFDQIHGGTTLLKAKFGTTPQKRPKNDLNFGVGSSYGTNKPPLPNPSFPYEAMEAPKHAKSRTLRVLRPAFRWQAGLPTTALRGSKIYGHVFCSLEAQQPGLPPKRTSWTQLSAEVWPWVWANDLVVCSLSAPCKDGVSSWGLPIRCMSQSSNASSGQWVDSGGRAAASGPKPPHAPGVEVHTHMLITSTNRIPSRTNRSELWRRWARNSATVL